ncbi:hypothetical protein RDWZM_001052 [Blomia tropicalis]|uniref:INTS8 TPR repeats domain-containing protein n=1 Tax=Blomia tropicalis TaxID=40697 RepID=A0A9Q0MDI8_BLOTA|nr:hypothetical protein RDWZM_001052 [Blomia tropicalis]
MTTQNLWLDIILHPNLLDENLIKQLSEEAIIDLLVHLISNGSNLLLSISTKNYTNLTNGSNSELQKNTDNKKFNNIRFLVLKLVSYFNWDLNKISDKLPSTQQEFVFTEFKRFCEQENVSEQWTQFSLLLYHRWVLNFVLKSIFPNRQLRIGVTSWNHQLLDPYFVAPEIQEGLNKKLHRICLNSLSEMEKIVSEYDSGKRYFNLTMPTFECFQIIDSQSNRLKFVSENSKQLVMESYMNELNYELGRWHFIHEDYPKANSYFIKIKNGKKNFIHLEGYKLASVCMSYKDVKMVETDDFSINDGSTLEKYLHQLIKEKGNSYEFDLNKPNDNFNTIQLLKYYNNSCSRKDEMFLLNRMSKYLIFKLNGFYEFMDENSRDQLLNISIDNGHKNLEVTINEDGELIEEGEINGDEELMGTDHDDDPELALLEATEPELIISLIPKINRPPLSINNRWMLPENQMILLNNMTQPEYVKSHIILAKASELRNAKYFFESRTLYLSLMEDVQASNPHLADAIQYELFHTDLETFFNINDVDERMMAELELKCLQRLRSIDSHRYVFYRNAIELACIFLVDNKPISMKEFLNCQLELIRFCSCLAVLSVGELPKREHEKKAQEIWEFCFGSFIPNNAKFPQQQFFRIAFYSSFETFISKFKNEKIINIISTCLAKIYNMVKDNPSQIITIHPQWDHCGFSSNVTQNVLSSVDIRSVSMVVDNIFRTYLQTNPNDHQLLKYYGDFLLAEGIYHQAMKYFIRVVMLNTNYFSSFEYIDSNELLVQQMIICSAKMNHNIQAAVLYQLYREPDYGLAFKELSGQMSADSSDDLYECIWDVTLLEYLVNFHNRQGNEELRQMVTKLISQLDLNINNGEIIAREAANLRKNKLFRLLAKQYL